MARIECPRCAIALKETKVGHLCTKCDGCWLSHDQLQAALSMPETELRKAGLGKTLDLDVGAVTQHTIRCPQCSLRLRRQEYVRGSALMVDTCFEHGMWLDDGELRELREFLES